MPAQADSLILEEGAWRTDTLILDKHYILTWRYKLSSTRVNDMNRARTYINEIVRTLCELDPYRIVLFGSQATNTTSEYSDLDLLVILDSAFIPNSYEDKMKNKLLVRDKISEVNRQVPIDLVVFTRAEFEIIERNGGSFLNEIRNHGKILYEKAN